MSWPVPGPDFSPLVEIIEPGTVLFRVHRDRFPDGRRNDGTTPNPGFGRSARFSFFGDPAIPVLYAAQTPEAAVYETILHSQEPGSVVVPVAWRHMVLSAIEVQAPIRTAAFHGAGLRRLGLHARQMTDTPKAAYPYTVQWAEAAWRAGLAGVSYMSRQFNSAKAHCLFGDRLNQTSLMPVKHHPEARLFQTEDDAAWLAELARDVRVVLRRPDFSG